MNLKAIKAIVYDLDGTIISTVDLQESAWIHAGKQFGVKVSEQFLQYQKGIPADQSVKKLLSDAEYLKFGKKLAKVKEAYSLEHAEQAKLFPEFIEAIDRLEERGFKIGICTSALFAFVKKIFARISSLHHFSNKTVCRKDFTLGKPNPEPLLVISQRLKVPPAQILYVGDAFSDYEAAKAAGCTFVYFCAEASDPRIPSSISRIQSHIEILNLFSIKK